MNRMRIDWKLQNCLSKPTRWIDEKTEETKETQKHKVIKGTGEEKHNFGKRCGE